MKRKIIFLAAALLVLGVVFGPQLFKTFGSLGHHHESQEAIDYYTCPMHPHIHESKPGSCPICGMKLVPVYKQGTTPAPSATAPTLTITPERQTRIGLTTAPVEKMRVSHEIRTVGRVAFDPELAVAQREFVEIAHGVPALKSAAVKRLKLLGMSADEIKDLEKQGRPDPSLTLPEAGEPVWIYAPIYEHEIPLVKVGDDVTLITPNAGESFHGTVRGLEPVIDPMTRSIRARIEVMEGGGKLFPESALTVSIQEDLGEQTIVPESSVIDTGARQLVFVIHDGQNFEARPIQLGPTSGDHRVILSGLTEGEIVASSAAFLIDSESQLKAAVTTEGHQH